MKELIDKLNGLQIRQTGIDWVEDIPEDIYEEYIKTSKEREYNLNINTRRWYELSTTVIDINSVFIGIKHISNIFSESMDCSDLMHTLEFFEMKEVQTITYEAI